MMFEKKILIFLLSLILFVSGTTIASQTGIPGYSQNSTGPDSCHACHDQPSSAPSNTLTITGNNVVLAGSINSYTLKLVAPYYQDAVYGGFDILTNNGILISPDAESWIINNELVHSDRKATTDTGSSYEVQWNFDWQAPVNAVAAAFYACGLPVDGDGYHQRMGKGYMGGSGSTDGLVACTTFSILIQQPPSAIAGNNQTVTEGSGVSLDGSLSSDVDSGISSYLWDQLSGPVVTPLNNANTDIASFTAPDVSAGPAVELVFRLTVTDNDGLVDTDMLSIFVQDVAVTNMPPVADAGIDQSVNENAAVSLDASGSTDDGSIVAYFWEQVAGVSTVSLNDNTLVNPGFTTPMVGSTGDVIGFQLTVTDDLGLQSTASVNITVNDVDTPPVAKITDASGIVISAISNNAQVTLYGNFSNDADGPITAYSWVQMAGPAIVNPGLSNGNSFTFTAPDSLASSIDIRLTVTGDEGFVQDSITVSLTLDNLPPIVDAGIDQVITEGEIIVLDGTVTDPNNNISSILWRQINCASSCMTLPVDNQVYISFVSPPIAPENSGLVLEFELSAIDAEGLSASSIKRVTINDNGVNGFPDNAITFTSFNNRPMAITVESLDSGIAAVISKLLPEDNASVADDLNRPLSFPYDLTNLEITLSAPGKVIVTLYFPEAVPEDFDFYQYLLNDGWVNTSKAKNFDDLRYSDINGWSEITEEVEFNQSRTSVTIFLTDGGPSDTNPATNIVSIQSGIGENQISTASQPGVAGLLNPFVLIFISLLRGLKSTRQKL